MYGASLSCSPTRKIYILEENENSLPPEKTGIVDSSATNLYIAPNPPHDTLYTSASRIRVGTTTGKVAISTAKEPMPILELAEDLPTTGYIIPTFTNTLIGIGPIYDTNCTVVFKKHDVTVISQ